MRLVLTEACRFLDAVNAVGFRVKPVKAILKSYDPEKSVIAREPSVRPVRLMSE